MIELDNLNEATKKIYEYFGYESDWRVCPIDDCREYFWALESDDSVLYSEDESFDESGLYGGEIRQGPYVGAEYTAMEVNTGCDGNRLLMIFSNNLKREAPDE